MKSRIFGVIKKILGVDNLKKIRPIYHGFRSYLSALYFGFPASKLKIIAITGTKGKTSTSIYTGRLFNKFGIKTGYITTATIFDGNTSESNNSFDSKKYEKVNQFKMTTIDSFDLNKLLSKMVKNGCEYVVLELSSQGLFQNRHFGLGKYDLGMFLNIYPEHIESHGSFENYLKAKGILFQNLKKNAIFLGNGDDPNTEYMANIATKFADANINQIKSVQDYKINFTQQDLFYKLEYRSNQIRLDFFAPFEAINFAFALRAFELCNPQKVIDFGKEDFDNILGLLGRMQVVNSFDNNPVVIVDYAHEPESLKQLLTTFGEWKLSKKVDTIIHVLSCDGVGRDDWKKPVMGDLSYAYADYTVLTTDNYEKDDDPNEIINYLSKNYDISSFGQKYFKEIDRKKAFKIALDIAKKEEKLSKKCLIVSTGVGSEYGLTQPTGVMEWDEVMEWRKIVG
jgi:UDP-N-acetylmuramoyl-L-alanyl-D-glutamate--2,6-diaminopimelate ligase